MEKRILTLITAFFTISAIAQPPPPPPPAGNGTLKINEVDYDIPGSDTAEFIELYNTGAAMNLSTHILILINGANDQVYDTIFLPNVMLGQDEFFVICGSGGNVVNCDQMEEANADLIQNGGPDAIALIDIAGPFLVDAVSYEGDVTNFTETTGVTAGNADNNTAEGMSMSRYPDGTDSDNNDADFQRICSTPGTPNCPTVSISTPIKPSFGIYPNPVKNDFTISFSGIESAHVAVSNLLGKAIFKKYVSNKSSLKLESDQLPQGIYFVTVDTGSEILTKRFVKR